MEFASNREVKSTRKARRCDGCLKMIEVGSPAFRWAGKIEGEFYAAFYHVECREAECALNDLCGTRWDEWQGLHDLADEHRPWLCETFPVVASRLGILEPTP